MPRAASHRMGGVIAILPGLVIVAAMVPSPAFATAADWQIRQDTTLTEDFHGTIEITRDGVTLDCAGHKITGDGHGRGIVVDKRSNVTVKNCDVSNFADGIWVSGGKNGAIVGNTLHHNNRGPEAGWVTGEGIWVQTSSGLQIADNVMSDNSSDGFGMRSSMDNLVARNTSLRNQGAGFWIEKSQGNTFEDNRAEAGDERGFIVIRSSDNTLRGNQSFNNSAGFHVLGLDKPSSGNVLEGNTASANRGHGFFVEGLARQNKFRGNSATDNGEVGFLLIGEDVVQNTFEDNTASGNWIGFGVAFGASQNSLVRNDGSDNDDYGVILVQDATFNGLVENRAYRNGVFDASQDASSTDNTWENNCFGTTDGIPAQGACSNDWFESAVEISALPFATTVDVASATNQPGEDTGCLWDTPGAVWYTFTPSADMQVMASVEGDGGSPTVMNVFYAAGPLITDLVRTTCAGWEIPAPIPLDLTAATTYYFQVAQEIPAGTVTFALDLAP